MSLNQCVAMRLTRLCVMQKDGSGRANSHSRSRPHPAPPVRGRGQPVDRRQQRKLLRQEKKKENQSRHHRQLQRAHQDAAADHDTEEDDDDEDDDGGDDGDGSGGDDDARTVTVQRPQEELKSILKKPTKKRKADLREPEGKDEEAEAEPAAKKRLGKGVRDRLAQDDAEIAYLEKKLRLTSKKKRADSQPSLGDETLDFLLAGLKDDYLDDRSERAVRENLLIARPAVPSEDHRSDDGSDGPDAFEGFSEIGRAHV